jgi:hypothetical protein
VLSIRLILDITIRITTHIHTLTRDRISTFTIHTSMVGEATTVAFLAITADGQATTMVDQATTGAGPATTMADQATTGVDPEDGIINGSPHLAIQIISHPLDRIEE